MSNKDNYLVIDLEMTCEETTPKGYVPEIIQIGIVELNAQGSLVSEKMLFVKPTINQVSAFCTKLTGVTPKQVKSASPLVMVMNTLVKYGIKNKKLVFWGGDNLQFQNECELKGIDVPISTSIINLSLVHSALMGTNQKIKLNDALKQWGITPEGKAHDALVDAKNTAKLFTKLIGVANNINKQQSE